MINNEPNIFEFATKELSQDAIFCYILDCYNYNSKKSISINFLKLIHYPYIEKIIKIEIKQQEDHSDIKAIIHLSNGMKKYIIVEDKVYTSLHNNQLQRYRKATIERENCCDEDIFGIFFKIGKQTIWEKLSCTEAKFHNLDYIDFANYINTVSKEDCILSCFNKFFKQRISFYNSIDHCKFNEISNDTLNKILNDRYGQRCFSEWLFLKIFSTSYTEKKLYSVNNFGNPCTQYEFIFDKSSNHCEWKIPPEEFPQRNYACFFRIDRNSKGWYISIRQYFKNGSTDLETLESTNKRKSLFEFINISKDDSSNRPASKEKTLLQFKIKSISDIKTIIPLFKSATEYLLNCI